LMDLLPLSLGAAFGASVPLVCPKLKPAASTAAATHIASFGFRIPSVSGRRLRLRRRFVQPVMRPLIPGTEH
jgi:hypothetical protein